MLDVSDVWKSPFHIDRRTPVATYGSCFAQHFSRSLVERGYSWINAEPGLPGIPLELQRAFNYGVFSARTGNIYTASNFRQWVSWAMEGTSPPPLFWEKNGKVYDPFRPTVEPDGFSSISEMEHSRGHAVRAFRQSLLDCDLLVFTLGLTESWWDSEAEIEFAMCPGTIAGSFDPKRHVFRNQDYDFVRASLEDAISMIRKQRQGDLKVLLTVSPVPLTATNSEQHVLVATMESKSILRAVAGKVAGSIKDVSYFPSYELINSPVFRGSYFEPNLRSVSKHGVAHVMNCFFSGLGEQLAAGQAADHERIDLVSHEDVMCDEELLSAFGVGN